MMQVETKEWHILVNWGRERDFDLDPIALLFFFFFFPPARPNYVLYAFGTTKQTLPL